MRILLMFLIFFSFLQAKVLTLNEAFKSSYSFNKTGIFVKFKLAPKIHLYKKELKITLGKQDISSLLNYPQSVKYQGKESFTNSLLLFIPTPLLNESLKGKFQSLKVYYQGCSEDGFCYLPSKLSYEVFKKDGYYHLKKQGKKLSKEEKIVKDLNKKSALFNLASFFIYGLLLAFTPCILPMIPILSSLIASRLGDKKEKKQVFLLSFIYVFFMSLAYALIGVLVSLLGFNIQGLLQTPEVLITFALLFVLLAASMFGLFTLQLPSKLTGLVQAHSNGKGYLGVAVMGFLSALIVGPCIAPPLAAALLFITQSKDVFFGALALFTMSFGMGMPLLFIGLGGKLIRPGLWMDKIKGLFGFLMLGMAIWLLSRVISEIYIAGLYGLLGIFFCVYMGLLKPDTSKLALLKKSFLLCVLAVCMLAFARPVLSFFTPSLAFKTTTLSNKVKKIQNLKELSEALKEKSKTTLLYYTASWCSSCKLLKPYFKKADLSAYNFYQIDLSKNTKDDLALMKKFQVFGPPVLVFIKPKGGVGSLAGYEEIKDFLLKH